MVHLRPFRALRPVSSEIAAAVIAPPYDVLSREEAHRLAADRPRSFLHVSRPEIDLAAEIDEHDDRVYAGAGRAWAALKTAGAFVAEAAPSLYLYRLETPDGHRQTGIAATFSVGDYEAGRIARHEKTRAVKEDDRTRHLEATRAQTGPVFLALHGDAACGAFRAESAAVVETPPLFDVVGGGDVRHRVWRVPASREAAWIALFAGLPRVYIADGHHRAAAAARVARVGDPAAESAYFLAVAFPSDELRILSYHRVLAPGPGGPRPAADWLAATRAAGLDAAPLAPGETPSVPPTGEWILFLREGAWRVRIPPGLRARPDELDVELLQRRLLGPWAGVGDPRTDPRLEFVGGIRGWEAVRETVADGGAEAAFLVAPTPFAQVVAVADEGGILPPKSTWFEPKLGDGLLVHEF